MKKIYIPLGIIGIAIIAMLFMLNRNENNIWEANADKLINKINSMDSREDIKDFSKFTPFKWDTLYSFAPYTPSESIYKVVGYKWHGIRETVSENMNQVVFLKDGKVVCYIYGYPEHTKVYFNFGEYKGSYIKLTSGQKVQFSTTKSANGITYLNFIT